MQLPIFLDVAVISQVAFLVIAVIQYFKNHVPEWLIKPYLQVAIGLGWSFAMAAYTGPITNWVFVITNGILGGLIADSGYQVLNNFGLRSIGEAS